MYTTVRTTWTVFESDSTDYRNTDMECVANENGDLHMLHLNTTLIELMYTIIILSNHRSLQVE